jgi:peflin
MDIYQGVRAWGLPSHSCIGVLTVRAQSWENAFRHFDKSKDNVIDGDEVQQALETFGYALSPQLRDLLIRKYGAGLSFEHPISSAHCSRLLNVDAPWPSEEAAVGGAPAAAPPVGHSAPSGISFDRFMRACVVVKQAKEVFDVFDKDSDGRVKINYETFLTMAFKLP